MNTITKISRCRNTDTGRAFLAAINHYLNGVKYFSVGSCSKCGDCQSNYGMGEEELELYLSCGNGDEGGFSRCQCDSCGSSLGGNRHDAHGFVTLDDGREILCHFSVCVDCLMYHANGDLPERWEG